MKEKLKMENTSFVLHLYYVFPCKLRAKEGTEIRKEWEKKGKKNLSVSMFISVHFQSIKNQGRRRKEEGIRERRKNHLVCVYTYCRSFPVYQKPRKDRRKGRKHDKKNMFAFFVVSLLLITRTRANQRQGLARHQVFLVGGGHNFHQLHKKGWFGISNKQRCVSHWLRIKPFNRTTRKKTTEVNFID